MQPKGQEKMHDEYIKSYKPWNYMAMQRKAWMLSFIFKEFLSFKKD
jgi:hypothetical protein